MNLYSIDVRVYATAYIKANSEAEAFEIAKGLKDSSPDILDSGGDLPVSGDDFDSENLPDVSLSPAMTVVGPDDDTTADDMELQEEGIQP